MVRGIVRVNGAPSPTKAAISRGEAEPALPGRGTGGAAKAAVAVDEMTLFLRLEAAAGGARFSSA